MTAPRGHVQIPRPLLYSERHGGLAVWAWAMYETLMQPGLGGGRAPAVARRCYVAERAGASTGALDDARRELLAPVPGGPYLSRSTPRGAMRSVKHAALRLPRETGEPFSPVPSWTLNLVWAGRRRPAGRISADAWRLYAACVDRASRAGGPRAFDATMRSLGAALHASPATGRRRLAELEAAGLIEVTERPGGWLSLRPVLDADEARDVAETYASEGRRRIEPRRDSSRIVALTPGRNRQAPPADSGTPQESPSTEVPAQESVDLPVRDGKIRRTGRARAGEAGKPKTPGKVRPAPRRRLPSVVAELYRVLPSELSGRISEHGSRRVLEALAGELEHRSVAELAERIARNWEHWRYRLTVEEPIRDAVAVAIRLTRRGLDCPDVRCEDGHQLDLDAPCKACALAAAERTTPSAAAPDHHEPAADAALRRALASDPGSDETRAGERRSAVAPAAVAETKRVDGRRYGALARALLKARTAAERDAILADHQAHMHCA